MLTLWQAEWCPYSARVREDGTQLDDWHEMLDWIRSTFMRRDDADRHREKWFEEAPLRDPKHVLK